MTEFATIALDPCIEIEPKNYVIVVGPHFTSLVLREMATHDSEGRSDYTPIFAYSQTVEVGITLLLEAENEGERSKYEMLYRNAYELDPILALRKVSATLRKRGRYEEWLNRLFDRELPTQRTSRSLQHLLELQRNGALLVYTHCDGILSRAANLQPVLLENADLAGKWTSGDIPGFLHINGVHTQPDTVKLDCDFYENTAHPLRQSSTYLLQKVFGERHALIIGFDAPSDEPLQAKFLEVFVGKNNNQHTFLMSEANIPSCLSLVPSPRGGATNRSVSATADNTWALWKQIDLPTDECDNNQMLGLLIAGKQGATEISKMMFKAPGVNFALVNPVVYEGHNIYTVLIRVAIPKLQELWQWIFATNNVALLTRGLFAVVMQSGTFIWLRGKPIAGNKVANNNMEPQKPSTDSEVAMETNDSNLKAQQAPMRKKSPSRFMFPDLPSVSKGRKIPRYTVTKFKLKTNGAGDVASLLKHKGPRSFTDDSSLLLYNGVPKSVFYRRGSLPPMKPEYPQEKSEQNSALSQLVENLQNPAAIAEPPSYVAIKQALLCDTYKRRQSMQIDPITLKNLLQAKMSGNSRKPDLISQRRRSDPGSYLKQRSFTRRKELFVDENRMWSNNYSKVIERKIMTWQQKRQERRQRQLMRKQASSQNYHILNALSSSPSQIQTKPSTTVAPQTTLFQSTPYPFVFPQTLFTPTTTPVTTGASVYNPYMTPYTFVNPYSAMLPSGQPMTYYIPQGNQQKLVYLVPSTNTGPTPSVTVPNTAATSSSITALMPQIASLIAPTPVRATASQSQNETKSASVITSPESRKRHNSLPEQLSALLQPTDDPEIPPSVKRHRGSDPTVNYTTDTRSYSPQAQSPTLLETHLRSHLQQNGLNGCNGNIDEQEVVDIVGGSPHAPTRTQKDASAHPRTQLQLWQFLLELLLISANSHLIQWTDNDFEFQINKPDDVAELWGKCTNNHSMNYEKLKKGLRYYYSRGILGKVQGRKLTFRYSGNIRNYVQMRRSQMANSTDEVVVVE